MRIAIWKESTEINEEIVRSIQMAITKNEDIDQRCSVYSTFTTRQLIDAILSHFAKMLNYQKPIFSEEERERIDFLTQQANKETEELNVLRFEGSFDTNKMLNMRLKAMANRIEKLEKFKNKFKVSKFDVIEISQSAWALGERQKDEMFKLNSDLTTKLNFAMDRIDELSKRVERNEKDINTIYDNVGKVLDRQDRFLSKLEAMNNKV